MNRSALATLALLSTTVLPAASARAQLLEQEATPARAENWQASLGVRSSLVRSTAYDPFSSNDVLPQVSLTAQRVLVRGGSTAFAAGVATDYGGSSADARSAPARISMLRLSALAEGRLYAWQRAYGFVRFAPGMMRVEAELTDASSPNGARLHDDFDVLSVDMSGGAAMRLSGPANPVAAWASLEGGYGWAGSHHLLLAPSAAPRDQPKLAPVDLGTIAPRGVFMRIAVSITY